MEVNPKDFVCTTFRRGEVVEVEAMHTATRIAGWCKLFSTQRMNRQRAMQIATNAINGTDQELVEGEGVRYAGG